MNNTYAIIRSHGKSYFGKIESDSDGISLKNAVEMITMIMPTPTGFQKRVTVTGIDYCTAPAAQVTIKDVSLIYDLDSMLIKDAENLMKDYEEFLRKDDLVKTPPKKTLITP